MALFGNRKAEPDPEIARLRGEMAELRTRVIEAERVASDCASEAYKRMKKAEQAERRALAAAESENQDRPHSGEVPAGTPLAPPLTGARARIAARRMRLSMPPDTNGVHP